MQQSITIEDLFKRLIVLNPQGKPPAIQKVSLAPRPSSLSGKTVYFVDARFAGGESLLRQFMNWFHEHAPDVTTVFREKLGAYFDDDPKLWNEIKEKGDAMVMAIGH